LLNVDKVLALHYHVRHMKSRLPISLIANQYLPSWRVGLLAALLISAQWLGLAHAHDGELSPSSVIHGCDVCLQAQVLDVVATSTLVAPVFRSVFCITLAAPSGHNITAVDACRIRAPPRTFSS
jgi:hypothetical protein